MSLKSKLNKGVRGQDGEENVWTQRGEVNEARSDGKKKFRNHCSSPNITTIFKLKRKRWTGHLTHTRQNNSVCRVLVENLKKEEVINHIRRWGHNITINFRAG